MEVDKVLYMVGGAGENSYAANSLIQRKVMLKSEAVVTAAIREVCRLHPLDEKIAVADLGCSSGPNTLLLVHNVAITISRCYRQMNRSPPDVHFFLNDLPGNDFNMLFRSIEPFRKDLYGGKTGSEDESKVGPVFVSGVPGSYFGRILPKNSIDFVHSSYSLHFLFKLPQALQTDSGARLNKRNIYLSKTSSPVVIQSYMDQFQKDFYLFLRSRAEELKVGGQMVLVHMGRDNVDPCYDLFGALAEALSDMISEELVEEASLETFNLPAYAPSLKEMSDVIHREGSFALKSGDVFTLNWDPFVGDSEVDDVVSGKNVAKYMRAVLEPILASHFKDVCMDVVFERYAEKIANVPREAFSPQCDGSFGEGSKIIRRADFHFPALFLHQFTARSY